MTEDPTLNYFILFFVSLFVIRIIIFFYRTVGLWPAIKAALAERPLPVYFELVPKKLPPDYENILIENDKYYRSLPPKLQRSYGSRVMKFIDGKDFVPREGLEVTREMIVMIASAAVKITFGLRYFRFSNFHSIIIYPGEFFSRASRHKLKGETNAAGVIAFSWDDIVYGNSIPNDSINLGYHEFAHALFIENLLNPADDIFKTNYREWLMYVKNNQILDRVRRKGIFRRYATVNEMEFFAVALENFFENPKHFKEELPVVYKHMCRILNQDLANSTPKEQTE